MESNIKINFRSIKPFENISDQNIQNIEKEATLYDYEIGQKICKHTIIPNQVVILLSGEARLINVNETYESQSIAKLKSDSIIGFSSLLRGEGCENVSASTEVLGLVLTDKLFLKLYQEELEFRKACNEKLEIAELYAMLLKIRSELAKDNIKVKESLELLKNNSQIKVVENNTRINESKDNIIFAASANIIEKNIGDILNNTETVCTRGYLPARLIVIPSKIYQNLISNESSQESNNSNISDTDLKSLKSQKAPSHFARSEESLGQYDQKKEFKIIKADGVVRETLACFQMIANELNLPFRSDAIEKIIRESIKNDNKPSFQTLGGISSMLGLHSTHASGQAKFANRIPKLAILEWGKSFALVKESNPKYLELISPSQGIIHIKSNELEKQLSENVEFILVEKSDQTPEIKFGLKWLIPGINRYKSVLLQVLLASFVVQLFGLANPLMIQVIIDKVISQRSLDTLQILGIALIFITILGGILSSLRTFLFTETTNRIDTRLGAEVIDHLLRLPLGYFDKRPVGELGSRIAELEKIRNFLTGQALTTILDAAFSLIYIVVMVIYSWLLTIIALGVVPIQILITIIGTPLIRGQIRAMARENAKTQSHLVEVLTGIQTVKAQNVEQISRWKWQDLYSNYIRKSFQKTITGTALGETSQVLQQLSQLLVLWVGATLVLNGQLTLGQLIAFRIISGYVTQPLLRLSSIWQNIQELRVSFERLADIVDAKEEAPASDKGKIPLPPITGVVEFQDVSFSFGKNQPAVLKKINLKINSGQLVGIVGQSGSGKSTLMKLLPRLYKPNLGRILIDGYDVDKVELYSLRRQIGIVPQEPLLFAGTVNENIALTDPDSSSESIVEASKIANAHDFIMDLSAGYNTNMGERGSGLSGGQKQRIAIARTLLNKPKLLIMDEATSALDYETEKKVCDGIQKHCSKSTVFFITHRLNTVRNADLILMLHQGGIAEVGTHDELMNLKGRYFALYRQQEAS